jgi:uncharacterized protein YozE (UPF0346 family)
MTRIIHNNTTYTVSANETAHSFGSYYLRVFKGNIEINFKSNLCQFPQHELLRFHGWSTRLASLETLVDEARAYAHDTVQLALKRGDVAYMERMVKFDGEAFRIYHMDDYEIISKFRGANTIEKYEVPVLVENKERDFASARAILRWDDAPEHLLMSDFDTLYKAYLEVVPQINEHKLDMFRKYGLI